MTTPNRILAAATEALKEANGNVATAAIKFGRTCAGRTDLQIALATAYLEWVHAGQPATRSRIKDEIQSRRQAGSHRRPSGMPTAAQKAGAVRAAQHSAEVIFARKIRGGPVLGKIKIRELAAIVQSSGHAAGSFVTRGYEDAIDAIVCRKISQHCVSTDPDATVEDCINPAVATKYFDEAKVEAAKFIQAAAARIASELTAFPAVGTV
jgi:hypothetical protein